MKTREDLRSLLVSSIFCIYYQKYFSVSSQKRLHGNSQHSSIALTLAAERSTIEIAWREMNEIKFEAELTIQPGYCE